MKKQVIISSFFVLILLFVFVPVNSGADLNNVMIDPPVKFPGELVADAPVYASPVFQKEDFHPEVEVMLQDDLVVDMLLELDEALFLNYLEDLVDFGPRRTGTQACWDAGDWIYDEFKAMGIAPADSNLTLVLKRLKVSQKGLGRKEKVQIASASRSSELSGRSGGVLGSLVKPRE